MRAVVDPHGFTLIEALLSMLIISILIGLSLPLYASFQDRNNVDLTTQSLAEMLRRAEIYARGVNGDSQWGVEIQPGSAVLFKGASFASRDTSFDESTTIASTVTMGGLTEVLFSKLSGAPNVTGNITLFATRTNDTRTVNINARGTIAY